MTAFSCPRCSMPVDDDSLFYGPCPSCRRELVEMFSGAARDVEAAAYEPKMNVVPNQVAIKD